VKAVDGMVKEQNMVVNTFGITMLFLALNLIGTYFVMMTYIAAVTCSLITLIGLVFWYKYALTVYNTFKYKLPSKNWEDKREKGIQDLKSSNYSFTGDSNIDGMSGYLTMKDSGRNGQHKLTRKYFVLSDGVLNYYSDQRDFELQPDKPLNKRPITFEGYMVDEDITEDHYELTIAPIDPDDNQKIWEFRCDTLDELALWRDALRETIKASNIDGEYLPPPPITSNATIFNE
jgi:hypothetical protein